MVINNQYLEVTMRIEPIVKQVQTNATLTNWGTTKIECEGGL
jgi:hypothetical protein